MKCNNHPLPLPFRCPFPTHTSENDNLCYTVVPLLKDTLETEDTPLERTQILKLAASTGNAYDAPSHQRTPL